MEDPRYLRFVDPELCSRFSSWYSISRAYHVHTAHVVHALCTAMLVPSFPWLRGSPHKRSVLPYFGFLHCTCQEFTDFHPSPGQWLPWKRTWLVHSLADEYISSIFVRSLSSQLESTISMVPLTWPQASQTSFVEMVFVFNSDRSSRGWRRVVYVGEMAYFTNLFFWNRRYNTVGNGISVVESLKYWVLLVPRLM